jgi:hypothetical protein
VCPTDFLEYIKLRTASWQPVTVAQNSAGIPSYYLNGSIPTIGPVGEITVSLITGDKLAIDENQLAAGLTVQGGLLYLARQQCPKSALRARSSSIRRRKPIFIRDHH